MLLIPQKLTQEAFIKVFFHSPQLIFCQKTLSESLPGREAYLSMHALSMVVEGEQNIRTYEGELGKIRAGNYALFKKGIYSISDLISHEQQFRSFLIFFDEKMLNAQFPSLYEQPKKQPGPNLGIFKQSAYLQQFWKSIEIIAREYPNQASELFPLKFKELLSVLMAGDETFSQTLSSLPQKQPRGLMEFMEKNYDKPLSIEDYAYLSGRSESTFRREFKARYGLTPRKWIIQKRMEKAREMLASSGEEVGRIALEVGYENTSHFISEFKKHFGYTPGQEISRILSFSDRKAAS